MIFVSEQAGGKAGKDSGKAKAKAVSRSARAGLQVSEATTLNAHGSAESIRVTTRVLGSRAPDCD